jgi:hypothetical protein
MNQVSKKLSFLFILSAIFITINSCKKTFDAPPAPSDPDLIRTHTIARLKSIHKTAGALDVIDTAAIISGVVIANDKSGNLYKTIYIQDETGAIQLSLDASGLFNSYPVGRKVFVKCKELCLSDYSGMIQLGVKATVAGTPSFQAIASNLIGQYVIGGSLNNSVPIKTVTLDDLKTNMQDSLLGTLIRLQNFEFTDTTKTFSDTSAYKNDINLDIRNCDGRSIIIRTSGYANFSGVRVPGGNGDVVALYTVFVSGSRSTRQLVLRDPSDLQLKGARCSLFEENFQGYTSSGASPLSLPGWFNIQETGDVPYTMATFGTNVFPKVSAFASSQLPTTNISSWLITPGINIPTGSSPKFTFTCARRYPAGTFKVYVSDNFNGNNVSTANWQLLTTVPGGPSNAFTPFDPFGPFDFSSYAGKKIHIGFRYEAAAGTSKFDVGTYEPDDIKISSK